MGLIILSYVGEFGWGSYLPLLSCVSHLVFSLRPPEGLGSSLSPARWPASIPPVGSSSRTSSVLPPPRGGGRGAWSLSVVVVASIGRRASLGCALPGGALGVSLGLWRAPSLLEVSFVVFDGLHILCPVTLGRGGLPCRVVAGSASHGENRPLLLGTVGGRSQWGSGLGVVWFEHPHGRAAGIPCVPSFVVRALAPGRDSSLRSPTLARLVLFSPDAVPPHNTVVERRGVSSRWPPREWIEFDLHHSSHRKKNSTNTNTNTPTPTPLHYHTWGPVNN